MTEQTTIKVCEFTTLPGARYRTDGDFSADQFFEERVLPVLKKYFGVRKTKIIIDLDDTMGYASSFVSQLAIRIYGYCNNKRKIKKYINIKSEDDPVQKEKFWNEINEAKNDN